MPCSQVRRRGWQVMRDGQPQTVADVQSWAPALSCTHKPLPASSTQAMMCQRHSLCGHNPHHTPVFLRPNPFLHLVPVCPCMPLSQWVQLWHNFWSQGPDDKGHFSSPPAHRKKLTQVLADCVPAASKEVWMEIMGFTSAMAPSIAASNTEHLIRGCGATRLSELGLFLVKFSSATSPTLVLPLEFDTWVWFSHLTIIYLILNF